MSIVRSTVSGICAVVLALVVLLLGVAISISSTILNSDFVVAELQDLPVTDYFADEARKLVPPEAFFLMPLIDQAAEDLEPWAREQMAVVVEAVETYVKGDLAFSATISFEEPKRYLEAQMAEVLPTLGIPGLDRLSEAQLRSFVQQLMREVDARIPDAFVITESFLEPGMLDGMRTAREYTGHVNTSLWLLPLLALVLILIIAAVQRWRGRPTAQFVGAALLLAGIGSLLVSLVVRSALPGMIPGDIPPEVATLLPGLIGRCLDPLAIYGVVVLLAGAGFVLLSFKLRPVEP